MFKFPQPIEIPQPVLSEGAQRSKRHVCFVAMLAERWLFARCILAGTKLLNWMCITFVGCLETCNFFLELLRQDVTRLSGKIYH